jgi:hypothetical protein
MELLWQKNNLYYVHCKVFCFVFSIDVKFYKLTGKTLIFFVNVKMREELTLWH